MDRSDGWLPLREYAAIGDGRTVALVGRDGAIDWLCLPDLDSPSVFARLLDRERGGSFTLAPAGPHTARRRYLGETNVLETTFAAETGTVQVVDALTLPLSGLAPARELVRHVTGVSGSVELAWTVEPRFAYGREARVERRGTVCFALAGGDALAVAAWGAGEVACRDGRIGARCTVSAGETATIVLAHAREEPVVVPARDEVLSRLDGTARYWRDWAAARTYHGPWRDAVVRSALALKLLVFAPTGAIAAAATTSLPERLGGDKNYDYRYAWIRDAAFTMNAFVELGCTAEAEAFLSWLLHASQLTHPELRVLYRLNGRPDAAERELPLEGYRGSAPVRVGNAAAGQLQLDPYGDLLDAAWIYADDGLDAEIGTRLAAIADFVCTVWEREDAGIWELRDVTRHFTEGKMKCAIALERACDLAGRGLVPDAHRRTWEQEAERIRAFVETRCWSEEQRSYVQAADGSALDASVLLAGQNRYAERGSERLGTTIDAIRRELGSGPFLHRYSGASAEEGAFVACSFWLASALARAGRLDEACTLMDELVAAANDVGLFAEQLDPGSGEFLGNLPQGLSHLALVNAAFAIEEARG